MEIGKNKAITIRAFEPEDAAEFTAACLESIDTVGHWLPWCHEEYSCEEATAWIALCSEEIQARNSYDYGIFRNADSQLSGGIAINPIDIRNRMGNIGYWVRESLHRQDYALEAVEITRNFGFQQLLLARLEIVLLADNLASRRVAENAGAEFECIAKSRLMHNGRTEAAAVYAFTTVA